MESLPWNAISKLKVSGLFAKIDRAERFDPAQAVVERGTVDAQLGRRAGRVSAAIEIGLQRVNQFAGVLLHQPTKSVRVEPGGQFIAGQA